jgi:hypothetical protein
MSIFPLSSGSTTTLASSVRTVRYIKHPPHGNGIGRLSADVFRHQGIKGKHWGTVTFRVSNAEPVPHMFGVTREESALIDEPQ